MKKCLLLAILSILSVPAMASASCQDVDTRLHALVGVDQKVREEWTAMEREGSADETEKQALQQRWHEIDRENLRQLKQVIAACGWPTSKKGSHDAWLLAQHADEDIAFQRQVRALLEAAVKAGTAASKDLAYLADRIAAAEGRPQEYGTQFELTGRCELTPKAVDDIALVNQRRLALGLQSVEDYLAEGRRRLLPADCAGKGR